MPRWWFMAPMRRAIRGVPAVRRVVALTDDGRTVVAGDHVQCPSGDEQGQPERCPLDCGAADVTRR